MHTDIPNNLKAASISLQYEKTVTPNGDPELVPFYHFKIIDSSESIVGHINFRVGDTRHILLCAGHIGYEVLPEFRGNSYAFFACKAIAPFVMRHYDEVILTAEVGNAPSLRVIEKLGAVFLDEIQVPEDDPSYQGGARRKRRYKWALT